MLIQLTDHCDEECSHCFGNYSRNGKKFITLLTLEKYMDIIKALHAPTIIQISGGEPTSHPEWYKLTKMIINGKYPVQHQFMFETNGTWLEEGILPDILLGLINSNKNFHVQIRTHPDYYPSFNRISKAKKDPRFHYFEDGINLFPLGRTILNHLDKVERINPACSNSFLIVRQVPEILSLPSLLMFLHEYKIFCKPLFAADGNIYAGETPECMCMGNIHVNSEVTIINNYRKLWPCNKCGLAEHLIDTIKTKIKGV